MKKQSGSLETALAGLIGAGVGSTSVGGLARTTTKHDETPEERRRRVRDAYVMGAVLGGGGGAGLAGLMPDLKAPTSMEAISNKLKGFVYPTAGAATAGTAGLLTSMAKLNGATIGSLLKGLRNPIRNIAKIKNLTPGRAAAMLITTLLSGYAGLRGGSYLANK